MVFKSVESFGSHAMFSIRRYEFCAHYQRAASVKSDDAEFPIIGRCGAILQGSGVCPERTVD
jgi:hypothetical protein